MSYIHHKLDDYYRNASLGRDYKELSSLYPNWASDLHTKGNTLSSYNLECIAVEGLIKWYSKQYVTGFDVDYSLLNQLEEIKSNYKNLSFYDWVNICRLCDIFKIRRMIFGDYPFNTGWKYEFVERKFPKEKELHNMMFYQIIIKKYCEKELIDFISYFHDEIKTLLPYFKNGSLFRTFINNNPEIKDLGISFQRIKILVEKMQVVVMGNNIGTDTEHYNPDIYKFDRLCDNIQECIYSLTKNYFSGFLEKKVPISINISELPIDIEKIRIYKNPVADEDIYRIRF